MLQSIKVEEEFADSKVIIETSTCPGRSSEVLRKISDTDSFPSFNCPVTQINFFHKQFEQGRFTSTILGN